MDDQTASQSRFARTYQAAMRWYLRTNFARSVGSAISRTLTLPQLSRLSSSDIPWAPLRKPLNRSTVVLISTGGVHLENDRPFDLAGDATFREIPRDTQTRELAISHLAYDTRDALRDINLVFPLQRLCELESEEIIERVADIHYGFGFMPNASALALAGRQVARRLRDADIDLALLVPA